VVAEFSTTKPVVFVDPLEIILDEMTVGQNFTISVKIFNVTNLYGIDLQFGWNSTVLKYLNHTKMIPVETYPDGILHSPTLPVMNMVDETASMPGSAPGTMYWLAEASMSPAESFDGTNRNCTIFIMAFQVLMLAESPLKITSCTLSDRRGDEISHETLNGEFRYSTKADFSFYPDIAVKNKIVYFNASVTGNTTNVDKYIWNFGDGTPPQDISVPECNHTYTTAGSYSVSLKVRTLDGKESGVISKLITVVDVRDLAVLEVSALHWGIHRNLTLSFSAKIANFGNISEECTAIAYFNITAVNEINPAQTTWIEFDNKKITIAKEPQSVTLTFNASKVPLSEAYYYILVNATGIPDGYDVNYTNNLLISTTPIFVTENVIYDILIEDFKFGYVSRDLFFIPLSGEDVTFQIKVRNNGTYVNAINVTLYINGTYATNWTATLTPSQSIILPKWTKPQTQAGHYNLTVVAKAGDEEIVLSADLHVVLPPQLVISHSPENPVANQTIIILDASASIHNDPEGNLTEYRWRIYAPYPNGTAIENIESAAAFLSITGNNSVINFTAPMNGNWTIVLSVTDNFGIGYSAARSATSSYRTQYYVWVGEAKPQEGGGFPVEYIAIIIVIIVLLVAGTLILRKKRRLKTTEE